MKKNLCILHRKVFVMKMALCKSFDLTMLLPDSSLPCECASQVRFVGYLKSVASEAPRDMFYRPALHFQFDNS